MHKNRRSSPEAIQIRREKVKVLLSQLMTTKEIAIEVGVSERTIHNDRMRIKQGWKGHIERLDLDQMISELQYGSIARRQELWKVIKEAKGQIKVNAIKTLADEEYRFHKFLQSMGIIQTAPERFEADMTFTVVSAIPARTKDPKDSDNGKEKIITVIPDEEKEEIKLLPGGK